MAVWTRFESLVAPIPGIRRRTATTSRTHQGHSRRRVLISASIGMSWFNVSSTYNRPLLEQRVRKRCKIHVGAAAHRYWVTTLAVIEGKKARVVAVRTRAKFFPMPSRLGRERSIEPLSSDRKVV